MPIGSGTVYNINDVIISQVSSSGTAFLETKLAAATSSLIYFDSNAQINSASLSSITVGTASYFNGNSISSSFSTTASYSLTSSYLIGSSTTSTASYAIYAETSSNAQNAQDILLYVKNTSGAIISKGSIVRIKDVENSSYNPTIELADFRYESSSANTVGYTNEQFAINGFGYVITEGKLVGVDTSAFTSGDLLYLSSSGQYTNVVPIPPNHGVRVGQVIRSNNSNGSIYVTIDNGAELDELHNVIDTSTTSSHGDLLVKSGSVWKNNKNLTGSYFITGNLDITQNISASATGSFGIVGIGTTSPSAKLEVQGSSSSVIQAIFQSAVGAAVAYNGGIQLGNASSNQNSQIYHSSVGDNTLTFVSNYSAGTGNKFIFAPGGTERVRFQQNGNVGIGTTSPSAKLEISSSNDQTVINAGGFNGRHVILPGRIIVGSVSTDYPRITYNAVPSSSASQWKYAATDTAYSINMGSGNRLSFEYVGLGTSGSTFTTWNTWMTLVSGSNNVGIGVSSPVNKLDVAGNISASAITASLFFGTASWANNASTASFLPVGTYNITSSWANNSLTASYISPSGNAFVQGGNSFGTTALLGTNDAQPLALETNGTTRMSINSNGNVAINTSTSGLDRLRILDTHIGSLGSSSLLIETNQNQVSATSANDIGIFSYYNVNAYTSSAAIQNQAAFIQLNINASGSFSGSYRASRNAINLNNTASLHSGGNIINTNCTNQISPNIPSFSIPHWTAGTQTYVDLITGNTTGSITNLYNHYIGSPFQSAGAGGITVTNSYGVYIAKQKTTNIVTNGWGIYQADTGDLNIFAGKTRIGSTTVPVNTLDVTGNISASVVTASLFGTASWANNASTASYVSPSGNAFVQGGNSFGTTALLGTNDASALIFETNGTGRVTIDTNGNVGIGTTSPAFLLDVSGSSRHGYRAADTHQFTGSVSLSDGLSLTNLTASNISASGNIIASKITSSGILVNGNLTVTGSIFASLFSASYIYITSSTLVVTDNILTLNALSPFQRYAGIEMYDSGSGNLSSFLWDGQGDYFFISGSGVNGKIISGPDAQADLTANYVPKATAGSILGNSTIQDNGSGVGILTAPNSVAGLTVNGNILFNNNYLIANSASSTNLDYIKDNDSAHGITLNNEGYWIFKHDRELSSNSGSNSTLDFGSFSANNATDNNYIAGNLLIGTTSSTAKVDISYGDYQTNGALRLGADIGTNTSRTNNTRKIGMITGFPYNNLSGSPVFTFIDADSTQTIVNVGGGASGKSGATEIRFFTTNSVSAVNTTAKVVIDSAGDMGIGVLSPVNKLDVAGNISCSVITASNFFGTSSWASNSLTASYLTPTNSYTITNLTASSISASGTIRAVSLIETSTIASKYNIIPLENQLDKLLKLNPVSFNYKQTDEPSIGLIAEEVGEIYPEFTSPNKDAVAYSKMVSVLIQSVKELKSIVDVQQKQINELLKK